MANENVGAIKIVGYLEKKGKMKVVTIWKKYWFVLEGRLLLYYRSQEEYLRLSPCKGSINMGLVTDIRPGLAAIGIFQIITRTTTITLRAKERSIQEKWLQALLDATGQQSVSSPVKMSHFRYSMDDLTPTSGKKILMRQNTLPNRFKNKVHRQSSILNKIRQIGGQSYIGSLDTINRLSDPEIQKRPDLVNTKSAKLTMNKRNEDECGDCCANNKIKLVTSETKEEITQELEKERRNSKTKWFNDATQKISDDENQNGIILTNDLYLTVEETKNNKKKSKKKPKIAKKSSNTEENIDSSQKLTEIHNEIILKNELYLSTDETNKQKINSKTKKKVSNTISNASTVSSTSITSKLSDDGIQNGVILKNDLYISVENSKHNKKDSKLTKETSNIEENTGNNQKNFNDEEQNELILKNDLYLSSEECKNAKKVLKNKSKLTKLLDSQENNETSKNTSIIEENTENNQINFDDEKQNELILKNDLYLSSDECKNVKKVTKNKSKLTNKLLNSQENNEVRKQISNINEKEILLQNDLYMSVQKPQQIENIKIEYYLSENPNISKNNIDSDSDDVDITLRNDLYASVQKSIETHTDEIGERISGIMIENEEYVLPQKYQKKVNSTRQNTDEYQQKTLSTCSYQYIDNNIPINTKGANDVEYYCTYEDLNSNIDQTTNSHIYQVPEPLLPPRREITLSESDVNSESSREEKKKTRMQKFKQKFSIKRKTGDIKSFREKSAGLIQRVMRKKKHTDSIIDETVDYESVEYAEPIIKNSSQKNRGSNKSEDLNLIRTLEELQCKLEERKTQIKQEIQKQSTSKSTSNSRRSSIELRKPIKNEENKTIPDENPPGLPPRRSVKVRSQSPFHDVPRNNTPVQNEEANNEHSENQIHYSIDKILEDLKKLETKTAEKQSTPDEDLSVKQLIEKFNHVIDVKNLNTAAEIILDDVSLRKKDNIPNDLNLNTNTVNRHSDELNKLLEELTKVTCAPLLTPGATSSLVTMKSDGLTDEEWLAITPIRRRRYSEPDYDVPRPHRSLQILPRSPNKEDDSNDIVISATRFFGSILPPNIDDKPTENSMSWRSMTPDSLEPHTTYHNAIKHQRIQEINGNYDVERDKSIGYEQSNYRTIENRNSYDENSQRHSFKNKTDTNDESSNYQINHLTELKSKSNENFLDSLEPFVEVSTVF